MTTAGRIAAILRICTALTTAVNIRQRHPFALFNTLTFRLQ